MPTTARAHDSQSNQQGHQQHVESGHEGVAVAAGARQPFHLQRERDEQQRTQAKTPAPFPDPCAPQQRRKDGDGHTEAQGNDLQRAEFRRQQLGRGKGGAPYGGHHQQGQNAALDVGNSHLSVLQKKKSPATVLAGRRVREGAGPAPERQTPAAPVS
jgi:hypothetical protein